MPKSNTTSAREQKLAKKLRENLRRRKAQANQRQENQRKDAKNPKS